MKCDKTACKKSSSPAVVAPVAPPVISKISPLEGPGAAMDTISGTGFSALTARDSVLFNGKSAAISSASDTQLVVTVPALAGTGVVTDEDNHKIRKITIR